MVVDLALVGVHPVEAVVIVIIHVVGVVVVVEVVLNQDLHMIHSLLEVKVRR